MKRFKTIYVCDHCGFESEDPQMFRELYGNIVIPEQGGIIGNNIWDKAKLPESIATAVKKKMMPFCHNSKDTLITGMTFCLKCYIKQALISSSNKPDSIVQKHEIDVLTSLLSEISSSNQKRKQNKVSKEAEKPTDTFEEDETSLDVPNDSVKEMEMPITKID